MKREKSKWVETFVVPLVLLPLPSPFTAWFLKGLQVCVIQSPSLLTFVVWFQAHLSDRQSFWWYYVLTRTVKMTTWAEKSVPLGFALCRGSLFLCTCPASKSPVPSVISRFWLLRQHVLLVTATWHQTVGWSSADQKSVQFFCAAARSCRAATRQSQVWQQGSCRLWRWAGDGQRGCQPQGMFRIYTTEGQNRFSSTFPLLIDCIMQNKRILISISVSISLFFWERCCALFLINIFTASFLLCWAPCSIADWRDHDPRLLLLLRCCIGITSFFPCTPLPETCFPPCSSYRHLVKGYILHFVDMLMVVSFWSV